MSEPAKLAVIDLGSNSFRLVVFSYAEPDETGRAWWRRTDEIHEAVRIAAGQDEDGTLAEEPMERALETLELYAHFCRATGVEDVQPVATSAIRDAANQGAFLHAARERTGLEVRVLSREEEARYGYLAAVNSTTLADGVALDLGGGSMQLTRVDSRLATDTRSWPLGAVRMTERFLPGERAKGKQIKALRAHVAEQLARGGLAGARRAPRRRRRHRAQPRLGRRDRRRAAVLRRAGLLRSRATRSTSSSSGSPSCRPPSARPCRASRPRAAT